MLSRTMTATAAAYVPPPVPADDDWGRWIDWANRLPNLRELGLRCVAVEAGLTEVVLDQPSTSLNPNGAVNGGIVIAAADQCMGIVALTTMEAGSLPATATLNAEFLRPAFPPLTMRATVAQRGKRLVFVAVSVEDCEGRLCVRTSGTMAAQSG